MLRIKVGVVSNKTDLYQRRGHKFTHEIAVEDEFLNLRRPGMTLKYFEEKKSGNNCKNLNYL